MHVIAWRMDVGSACVNIWLSPKMHVLVKFIYHTERQFGMAVLAFYCFVCDGENVCILLTHCTLRDMF